MCNHKAIISNEHVRNKFQLEHTNQFEHLYIGDEDSVQTAYDELEKGLNKTTSKSLTKKEKETKKPWVSTQSSDLIEQRHLHGKHIKIIAIPRTTTHGELLLN